MSYQKLESSSYRPPSVVSAVLITLVMFTAIIAIIEYYKYSDRKSMESLAGSIVDFDADQRPFNGVTFGRLSVTSNGGLLAPCHATGATSFTIQWIDTSQKVAVVALNNTGNQSSCTLGEPLSLPVNIINDMINYPKYEARLHARAEKERLELLKKAQGN